jgi:hypothetical protein
MERVKRQEASVHRRFSQSGSTDGIRCCQQGGTAVKFVPGFIETRGFLSAGSVWKGADDYD